MIGSNPIHNEKLVKPIFSSGLVCLFCALCLFGPLLRGQDTPAPAPAQQQTPSPTVAPPEIAKDDPDNGAFADGFYWLSSGTPNLRGGKKSANPAAQSVALPADDKKTKGFTAALPAGKFNRLEVSYFQAYGVGDSGPAPIDLSPFGVPITQGDELFNSFQIRNVSIVWNYLTFPSPPEDSKFRIKTLWGVQYTHVEGVINAPVEIGNAQLPAVGTRQIIYPVLGLAAEYIGSKHFYMNARVTGFALLHRADYWDAEANAVVHSLHIELFAGYKIFHFKTTPNNDEYFTGTLRGPIGGVRWVFH
jgi:hypothetical protein